MRSAAAAFRWDFGRRLRFGLAALGAYLAVLFVVQFVILGARSPIRPGRSELLFAFSVLIPLCAAFMYFIAVFSYGLAGELTGRQSLYPARMFTLPVSTAALAGWPMLYATLTLAGLWLLAALAALRPSGVPVPLVWPALFAAAFVAWLQVFAWMPYGLPGLRLIVTVLWLTVIDVVAFAGIEYRLPDSLMVAIMAPQIPLAYLAARSAVARARRGDTPDWRGAFARLGRSKVVPQRPQPNFDSAARAQAWLEWRQHGRSLPSWVAMLIPFEVLYLFAVRHETVVLTLIGLAGMLLTPPFLAAFVALNAGRGASFLATRPLGTATLVAAKLRTALQSAIAAWLLILVAIPLALGLVGSWPAVAERARGLADFFGPPRAAALVLLAVVLVLLATWKQLVQGLCIGLTGREDVVKASVLLRLCSLVVLGLAAELLYVRPAARIALWNSLRYIPFVLVALKTFAAVWVATRLARERLIADRTLVTLAGAWLALVLLLYGAFASFIDTPIVPHDLLMLLAILAVPFVRPAAVPLALTSNRHRGTPQAKTPAPRASRAARGALALLVTPAVLALASFLSYSVRNRDNGGFVSSGEERTYRLYVPKSHDSTRPTPLVISLHGGGLWGAAQMQMSGWNAVADETGILVVYPSGSSGRGPRSWRAGQGGLPEKEVRFLAELIDVLKASHNVDPARVYADGLSNGGGMAFVLSCLLPDRIAAIGMVAPALFRPWSECAGAPPVPMIAFHGTEDRFTRYRGGSSWVAPNFVFPSIPEWVETFARRNRCEPDPLESAVSPDVSRRAYQGCADGADVALYTVDGGGHTWPGGDPRPRWFAGETTRGVSASREMWKFFEAHPLRR
jgi:polyhydroxybutyrate depolymerase